MWRSGVASGSDSLPFEALHLGSPGHPVGAVVLLRLDLDADVEHLGRLAIARPHEVEIADEATDRGRGQALGAGLVADLVVERGDLGEQVRLGLGVHGFDREPPGRGRQQVEPAVRVAPGLADLGECADAGQRRHPGRADLPAIADEHDPERLAAVEAAPGHRPVAFLEDVERQDDARTEHRVQRKERDLHRLPDP